MKCNASPIAVDAGVGSEEGCVFDRTVGVERTGTQVEYAAMVFPLDFFEIRPVLPSPVSSPFLLSPRMRD
jgi:hypothetical protein